jgi:hypothetical protein
MRHTRKQGKDLPILLEALEKRLDNNSKLSPYILINKSLLDQIVREGRRYIRTAEAFKDSKPVKPVEYIKFDVVIDKGL